VYSEIHSHIPHWSARAFDVCACVDPLVQVRVAAVLACAVWCGALWRGVVCHGSSCGLSPPVVLLPEVHTVSCVAQDGAHRHAHVRVCARACALVCRVMMSRGAPRAQGARGTAQ
jgi:hypothetical protein